MIFVNLLLIICAIWFVLRGSVCAYMVHSSRSKNVTFRGRKLDESERELRASVLAFFITYYRLLYAAAIICVLLLDVINR